MQSQPHPSYHPSDYQPASAVAQAEPPSPWPVFRCPYCGRDDRTQRLRAFLAESRVNQSRGGSRQSDLAQWLSIGGSTGGFGVAPARYGWGLAALAVWAYHWPTPVVGPYPLVALGLLVLAWCWRYEARECAQLNAEARVHDEEKRARAAASVLCHRCGCVYDTRSAPPAVWHGVRYD